MDFFNGLWLMIFGIVFVSVLLGCIFDYKKEQDKLRFQMQSIEDNAVQKELANVKQRLTVLEKIITDKTYHLHEEFDSLNRD